MKILPLVKEMKNNVASSGVRLRKATTDGYRIANRASNIYKQGNVKKVISIARSVSGKIVKETSTKELPYMAGAIGMILPIPFATPILMGLGFLVHISCSKNLVKKDDTNFHIDTKI